MRQKGPEVLAALKQHARGESLSIRSNELAQKAGLPSKIVSNALNSLVVSEKHVRREKQVGTYWYRYWWADQ